MFAATCVPYTVPLKRLSHFAYDRLALLRLCFERLGTGNYDSLAAIDRQVRL
jgi:hypothetical protein